MKSTKLLTNNEISSFCQQTYYLFQAGITPYDAMEILLQDTTIPASFRVTIESIRDCCMQGNPFSEAVKATDRFPEYAVHMISLGEESGHLSNIMQALANYYEREENISDSIRDAIRYPLIMIGMMLLVIIVLLTKVLPIFSQVYAQLGTQMSGFALSLLNISNLLSRYSVVLVVGIAAIVLLLYILSRNKSGRAVFKKILSFFPFVKSFNASVASGRFASGMALTLSSGLDTYESLDLITLLVENKEMEDKIAACKQALLEGKTFAEALKETSIFTSFYTHMVIVGSRSGSLDTVMQQIAEHYERDTDNRLRSIISTLEPTLVIILSLFVGLILLSVILPLMGIMSMIG